MERSTSPAPRSSGGPHALLIVDPDAPTRHELFQLFLPSGCILTAFPTAEDFLAGARLSRPACILTALDLGGMGGEALFHRLRQQGIDIPVIFMADALEVPVAVRLMRAGAADVLLKPLHHETVQRAVADAWSHDRQIAARHHDADTARRKLAALTPRERELFCLFAQGLSYKEIAARLGISRRTVENHRAHLNLKLGHEHVTDFVRLSILARSDQELAATGD